MNPSDDELERRLREAFAAQAHQVTPDNLDAGREAEFAERLTELSAAHRKRRIFAGVGILAAAAAAAGVVTLAVLPDHQRPVNAAQSFSSTSATSTNGASPAATGRGPAQASQATQPPARQSSSSSGMTHLSGQPQLSTTASTGSTTSAPSSGHAAMSGGTPSLGSQSTEPTEPPVLPSGLPQAGSVSHGTTYAGPVPLPDPSGGADRMLGLPDGTKWQVAAQDEHSMTVHVTFQPTDITDYWTSTLPSDGWTQAGDGWQFPGSSYVVSAIDDSGTFTVSW